MVWKYLLTKYSKGTEIKLIYLPTGKYAQKFRTKTVNLIRLLRLLNTKKCNYCHITSAGLARAAIEDCTFKILPLDKGDTVICSTLHGTL